MSSDPRRGPEDPMDAPRGEASRLTDIVKTKAVREEGRLDERDRILRGLTGLTLYCDLEKPVKAPPASNAQPGVYFSRDAVIRLVSGEAAVHSAPRGSQSPSSEDPA